MDRRQSFLFRIRSSILSGIGTGTVWPKGQLRSLSCIVLAIEAPPL
jgi:hypothetical protein